MDPDPSRHKPDPDQTKLPDPGQIWIQIRNAGGPLAPRIILKLRYGRKYPPLPGFIYNKVLLVSLAHWRTGTLSFLVFATIKISAASRAASA